MNQNEFCDADTGFDYVFAKMNAIYGATFANNWRDVDPAMIRQVWKEECGFGLTHRPKMDYALRNLNPDKPPSALAFAKLLQNGPPAYEHHQIENTKTAAQIADERIKCEEAKAILRKLTEDMRMRK